MFDLSLTQLLFRLVAMLLVVALHGYAMAVLSHLLGDPGPHQDGRRTLNPFVHLDILGFLAGLLSRCGWIVWMPVEYRRLRFGLAGVLIVVVGAAAAPYLAASLLQLARGPVTAWLAPGMALQLNNLLGYVLDVSGWSAVANLLPIPPLAGGHVLLFLVPALQPRLRAVMLWSRPALAIAFVFGVPYLPRLPA